MRLSSVEAAEVNDDFISAAADCEHLCPQFHPALQSGSETVLRRMRRRYSVRRFLERIEQIRERLVHPAFTTDMIVGFPGETEEEFEQSLETCRRVGFMKIHIFPFSSRAGTKAAEFTDKVRPTTIRDRVDRMATLEHDLAIDYYRSLHGERVEVLVEQLSENRPGYVSGTDRRYVPVEIPGTGADIGQLVHGVGEQTFDRYLRRPPRLRPEKWVANGPLRKRTRQANRLGPLRPLIARL